MEQLSIFEYPASVACDPPRARRNDPSTSRLAAARAGAFQASHHARILAALEHEELTPREISRQTGIDYVAVQRRMKELQDTGRIAPIGATREGCRVWRRA